WGCRYWHSRRSFFRFRFRSSGFLHGQL
ncbi:hypothetical protein CP8484711_0528C, partial [Chlamydia psittaci 84-8471/1]